MQTTLFIKNTIIDINKSVVLKMLHLFKYSSNITLAPGPTSQFNRHKYYYTVFFNAENMYLLLCIYIFWL